MSAGNHPTALRAAPYVIWFLLAIPLVVVTYWYQSEAIYYGEYIKHTGRFAVWLLLLAMAVTPLRLLFPAGAWARWLVRNRRYFGVAAFAYAVPHVLAYIIKKETFALVAEEAAGPELWTGWLAMAIFLLLAVTSNNASVRQLGRSWRVLHRWVHVAALLTFAHWVLSAFDPLTAYWHLAVLAVLEAVRIGKSFAARA